MLQIIGLLGCWYLAVKGLEIFALRERSTMRNVAAGTALFGALVFAILIQKQVGTVEDDDSSTVSIPDRISFD
jgi:hypothetical protein